MPQKKFEAFIQYLPHKQSNTGNCTKMKNSMMTERETFHWKLANNAPIPRITEVQRVHFIRRTLQPITRAVKLIIS